MSDRSPYDYAVLRVVPNIEREEFVNVGLVLFSRARGYLGCTIDDEARITRRVSALAERFDVPLLHAHLAGVRAVVAGDASAGPIAGLSQSERFHWLTTHRSTAIQSSVLRSGSCVDPQQTLAALFESIVRR
jgi:Protein of unknown function (DUF3037)